MYYKIDCPVFFQSDRKSDKPLSVRGWLYIDFKNFGGTVATSAPNFAESTMSWTLLIEAARTLVSNP